VQVVSISWWNAGSSYWAFGALMAKSERPAQLSAAGTEFRHILSVTWTRPAWFAAASLLRWSHHAGDAPETRPAPWLKFKERIRHRWLTPFYGWNGFGSGSRMLSVTGFFSEVLSTLEHSRSGGGDFLFCRCANRTAEAYQALAGDQHGPGQGRSGGRIEALQS